MESENGVVYRLSDLSDHPLVYSSWLKSYRDSPMVRGVPNTIYFKKQHELIETFLVDPRTRVIVACNAKDPAQIFGYIVGQSIPGDGGNALAIHWIYVKQSFRNMGIARKLFDTFVGLPDDKPTSAVYFTHRVKTVDRLIQSVPHVVFNPYIIFGV